VENLTWCSYFRQVTIVTFCNSTSCFSKRLKFFGSLLCLKWFTRICRQRQGCSGVGTHGNGVSTPFCAGKVTWWCRIQTITLKHGCDFTDVLATRRIALLVISLQWNTKIQCKNTCRRMLTFIELFWVVFLFICRSHTSFFSNLPLGKGP